MTRPQLYVQASQQLNGVLRVQSVDEELNRHLSQYVDRYDTLRHQFDYCTLQDFVKENDIELSFASDQDRKEWERLTSLSSTPFEVDSPFTKEFEFKPFQHFGMNLICDKSRGTRGVLLQWATGSGKTVAGTQTSQKLISEGSIDLVIVCCERIKKTDWFHAFQDHTTLSVEWIDAERSERHRRYREFDSDVLILNYEKLREANSQSSRGKTIEQAYSRTDLLQIIELVGQKKVLLICDEAARLGSKSLQSKGIAKICRLNSNIELVAMTATPYQVSPLNVKHLMDIIAPELPLGRDELSRPKTTDKAFLREYVATWRENPFTGYPEPHTWKNLQILGRRLLPTTSMATKSDPRIAVQFPEKTEKVVNLDLSNEDAKVMKAVKKITEEKMTHLDMMMYTGVHRMLMCTFESALASESELAALLREHVSHDLLTTKQSHKYQAVLELLQQARDDQQKSVVFCFYANAVIPFYERDLTEDLEGVKIFKVVGGMKEADMSGTIDQFNDCREPAVLLLSDAGQRGINLYASLLINLDIPYKYSDYIQRRDRIDRIDSITRGILSTTTIRFVTEKTIEVADERRLQLRKKHSELMSDGEESLVDSEEISFDEIRSALFGELELKG